MISLTLVFLACCAVLQSSASLISDNWDEDELYKQLHDPAKRKIDVECETCFLVVEVIQFLARENRSEDEIAEAVLELCISLQMADQLVCSEIIPEFKVSEQCMLAYMVAITCSMNSWYKVPKCTWM